MGQDCFFFFFFFLEAYELLQVKYFKGSVLLQMQSFGIWKGLPDSEVNLQGPTSDLIFLLYPRLFVVF